MDNYLTIPQVIIDKKLTHVSYTTAYHFIISLVKKGRLNFEEREGIIMIKNDKKYQNLSFENKYISRMIL